MRKAKNKQMLSGFQNFFQWVSEINEWINGMNSTVKHFTNEEQMLG